MKKIVLESAIEMEQVAKKSRIRYACKPELQKLFDLLNLLPPDYEIKNTSEIFEGKNIPYRPKSLEWLEQKKRQMIDFEDNLKSFPKDFQAVVKSVASDDIDSLLDDIELLPQGVKENSIPNYLEKRLEISRKQIEFYEWFILQRSNLYRLVEIGNNAEKYVGTRLDIVFGSFFIEYAYLDEEGRIRRQPNRIAEILEGVEASRIRTCLICKKLFWANRKDKRCCSEAHTTVLRQRQSRINKEQNKKIYSKFAKLRKQRQANSK